MTSRLRRKRRTIVSKILGAENPASPRSRRSAGAAGQPAAIVLILLAAASFAQAADLDSWRSTRTSAAALPAADAVRFVPAGKTLIWRVKYRADQQDQRIIRQVGHVQSGSAASDPFDDPFGDKRQIGEAPLRFESSESMSLAPPANAADEIAQHDPPPLPPQATFLSARRLQQQDEEPCDRVYNDRNCCTADSQCLDARRKLVDDPITKISLDITPSFNPDADNPAEDAQDMNSQLGATPHRVWKDRQGNVIGEGRLTDYRRSRVLIAGADGEVQALRFGELSDDDLCFLTAWWGLPSECTLGDYQFAGRDWMPATFTWTASALCHKPIYFEEVQLERYGHSAGPVLQPLASGAHFFLNVAVLPYKMGINPPQECQYALGYYRPGSCAPWLVPPVPLSVRGGLMQAGVILGGIYVIP